MVAAIADALPSSNSLQRVVLYDDRPAPKAAAVDRALWKDCDQQLQELLNSLWPRNTSEYTPLAIELADLVVALARWAGPTSLALRVASVERTKLQDLVSEREAEAAADDTPKWPWPRFDPLVQQVFQQVRANDPLPGKTGSISPSSVLVELLLEIEASASPLGAALARLLGPADKLRSALQEELARPIRGDRDALAAQRRAALLQRLDGAAPLPSVGPERSLFNPDAVPFGARGRRTADHLTLGPAVRRLATLLAARNEGDDGLGGQAIAIGLFGDWGAGKSTFMNLLRERIDELVDQSRRAPEHGHARRVAQIQFNAWHYADVDLWASIASHIFDSLATTIRPQEPDNVRLRRELRAQLESSRRAEAEAKDRQQRARADHRLAQAKLERRRATRQRVEQRRGQTLWRLLVKSDKERQRAVAAAQTVLQELHLEPPGRSLQKDGEQALADVAQLETLLAELRSVGGGARALWERVALLCSAGSWTLAPLLVVAFALGLGIWFYGEHLQHLVAVGSAIAVAVVGRASVWQGRIQRAVGALEELRSLLDTPPRRVAVDPAVVNLERQLSALDAALEQSRGELDQAESRLREAQRQLTHIREGGLVYDFLADEGRRSTYRARLGLISTIRSDFQQLDGLLRDWRSEGADLLTELQELRRTAGQESIPESLEVLLERMAAEDFTLSASQAAAASAAALRKWFTQWRETGTEPPELPAAIAQRWSEVGPIERIVLYIDDLDRCEPERVAEVLQAVHLLLAFPLFSVVVGVDPRWLERALLEKYASRSRAAASTHRFEPHQYLEKIFQIPYSLGAMDGAGFGRLIRGLAPARTGIETGSGESVAPEDQERRERAAAEGAELEATTARAAESQAAKVASASDTPAATVAAAEVSRRAAAAKAERAEAEARTRRAAEARAKQRAAALQQRRFDALHLDPREQEHLTRLHPFVGTPREGKRLLNVYRLLRVEAAERYQSDFDRFEPPGTEYRAAQWLLAIQLGFPNLAARLFRLLAQWGRRPAEERELPKLPFESWNALLGSIDPSRGLDARATSAGLNRDPLWPLAEEAEAKRFASAVGRVWDELGPDFDPPRELDPYIAWASEVARYSFAWHRR
jgi:hypothetical protein